MSFTIKSLCGKYCGSLSPGRYDDATVCYVTLIDNKASNWLFDMLKSDDKSSYANTPMGELIYIDGDLKSIGWFEYKEDLRDIVKRFEECFAWLDTEKVLEVK